MLAGITAYAQESANVNDSLYWDNQLDQFVVTATRTPKSVAKVPILTRLINETEIQSPHTENITDLLEYHIPGISFKKDGRGINMQVQGLENDYILILIDGERMTSTPGGNIDLSRLTQSTIKQIEIIKGASSLLYGSNAIGMVINIITKQPTRSLEGVARVQYSKFQNILTEGTIGGKWGDWSAMSSFNYHSTKGYNLDPTNQQVYTINPYAQYSIKQNGWWERGNAKVTGFVSYYHNDQYNPPLSILDSRYQSHNLTLGLRGELQLNTHKLTLSYHTDNFWRNTIKEGSEPKLDTRSTIHTVRLFDFFKPIDKLELVYGGEANINRDYSSFRFGKETSDRKVYDLNAFVQGEWQIIPSLNLSGGGRYTYNSAFGSELTPKVNLMYSVGNFRIRGGYSHGFKAPDATELFSDFMMGTVSHNIGNPDLCPEHSRYAYFGVEYRSQPLLLSAEVYQNSVRDKIQSSFVQVIKDNGERFTELRYSNIGRVRIRGVQLNADYYPFSFLSMRVNYAFTDAVNLENNLQLKGNAKHTLNGSATLKGDLLRLPCQLSISARWSSPKINDLEIRSLNQATGKEEVTVEENRLKAYAIWKLHGQITPYVKDNLRLTLSLGVHNLFNFTDPVDYTTYDPGRRLMGTILFNF